MRPNSRVAPRDSPTQRKAPHESVRFLALALSCLPHVAAAQDAAQLTPRSLQAALAAKPEGVDAEKLAERIRAYFGGPDALLKGAAPKIELS